MNEPIEVLIAGMGGMGTEVAKRLLYQNHVGFRLLPFALTGADDTRPNVSIAGFPIKLVRPEGHRDVLLANPHAIVVDFTWSDAIARNAELYVETDHNFVMGTTGDQTHARLPLRKPNCPVSAVIDVNMGIPLVVVKSMLEAAAEFFPGSLESYTLTIKESHQKTKRGVSGTAEAFRELFGELGAQMAGDIESIRDREEGHGYHWFALRSTDGTVSVEINTKVDGRLVYALGTLEAIRFLHRRVQKGLAGRVFTMTDVLSGMKDIGKEA